MSQDFRQIAIQSAVIMTLYAASLAIAGALLH
jgi:hypothetical protein